MNNIIQSIIDPKPPARPIIYVDVTFPINEPEKFQIETNTKTEAVEDLILEFVRTQCGAGVDNSKANIVDVYKIKLEIDLTDDTFYVTHNCGNKGLREGILTDVARRHADKINN